MKQVKRILYINNFFSSYGGAEKTMYNEAILLRNQGVETYFFATDKKPYFEENYLYSDLFPRFINYRNVKKIHFFRDFFRVFYNFEAGNNLDKLIKQIKPDIARCCNIYYHLSPSVLDICKKNNLPVVLSIHDCRLFCPSGNLMLGNKKLCNEFLCTTRSPVHCITNLCKNDRIIPSLMVTLEYMFNKKFRFHDAVDSYICQSEAMLELAVKAGINRDKTHLLNTFMFNDYFKKPGSYENNSYFLFIGRISSEKGLKTLINALKLVPEIPVHIVGTGPDEYFYKNYALGNNLDNIRFMGFKTGVSLEEEYRNCIATILPCTWFENFPRTILESYAYGKPAIASRVGGIPEIIDEGVNGFTFEVGDHVSLAERIKMLYYNRELAIKMGISAREKAQKKYNQDIYLEKVLGIYNSVKTN